MVRLVGDHGKATVSEIVVVFTIQQSGPSGVICIFLHISALSNQQRFSSTTFLAWDNRDLRFLNTGQFSFNVSR